MLRPHFKNLLGINHFASISLVSEVAPLTDQTFGVGTKGGMSIFAEYYNTKYSFANMAPDYDLKERGFETNVDEDAFPYYYREDGVRLFNIMLEYTTNVLHTQFASNEALQSDAQMKEYLNFCTNEAKIKGFPEVHTREDYARVLATLIWNVTAYHSLSFTIENIDSYIPFRSPCVQKPFPMEESTEDVPFSMIVATLPYPKKCELILVLNNIITLRTVPTLT